MQTAFARIKSNLGHEWLLQAGYSNRRTLTDAKLFTELGNPSKATGALSLGTALGETMHTNQNNVDVMAGDPSSCSVAGMIW